MLRNFSIAKGLALLFAWGRTCRKSRRADLLSSGAYLSETKTNGKDCGSLWKRRFFPCGPASFCASPALGHLEKNLHSYPVKSFQDPKGVLPLSLWSAPNRRVEIESLARELIRLARDEGYRWRDMAILTGDLEQYRDLLSMVFSDYEIPFFLDKCPVLHHPLVNYSFSARGNQWELAL